MSTSPLRDADLANHLAATLTDLEFELLIRARITFAYAPIANSHPELCDSYAKASFSFHFNDKPTWDVRIGEGYSQSINAEGEILSATFSTAQAHWDSQATNKLSLLLPPPATSTGFEE